MKKSIIYFMLGVLVVSTIAFIKVAKPQDVAVAIKSWSNWLFETEIPKLLFHVSPGYGIKEKDAKIIKSRMKNLKSIDLGKGIHFIQEDYPHEIGTELAHWISKKNNDNI